MLIMTAACATLWVDNARAESVTFDLSVVLPPHVVTPAAGVAVAAQSIQQQAAVRDNAPVLIQSVVVL